MINNNGTDHAGKIHLSVLELVEKASTFLCFHSAQQHKYLSQSWFKALDLFCTQLIHASCFPTSWVYYCDDIMGAMASQITSLTIVYLAVHSGTDQRKHQSSTSLAFVRGIHRWSVNSPHKWPVTWKMFPFDDIIINYGKSAVGILEKFDQAITRQTLSWSMVLIITGLSCSIFKMAYLLDHLLYASCI